MPAPLVPDDDPYARLELAPDASPEAIELAWRALLKLHHPDVAGDSAEALERAKRINVAHDWLSDPDLRVRYDRERAGLPAAGTRGGHGSRRDAGGRSWPEASRRATERGAAARAKGAATQRTDIVRGEPAARLARFLARVDRLTPDELDRMAAAEPPPIAFLATIRRFVTPEARAAFADVEATLAARVAHDRWAEAGLREGLLSVAAELVLAPFLDDTLAEPFRSRARERLLRAWEASVDQPRHGPNERDVVTLRDRLAAMTPDEVASFVRAAARIDADERPWPESLDHEVDEALHISALLADRDLTEAIPVAGMAPAVAARARGLAGLLGHVTVLRHAFPAAAYRSFTAPFEIATRTPAAPPSPEPGIRRAR